MALTPGELLTENPVHRNPLGSESLPVPWTMIGADPSQFYDTERFTLPTPLQNPESLTSLQTLILGEFLNGSEPFRFNAIAPIPASPGSLPSTPSRLFRRNHCHGVSLLLLHLLDHL
ncbi:hypothetical protein B0H10DRAFT_2103258 [Mycena sp. CBHHK59/15]|nr:hypothetical protein B0H10DRAFT_2103258 [Mycena sp. CBHHK59/15]